jgi:hypothetical protein
MLGGSFGLRGFMLCSTERGGETYGGVGMAMALWQRGRSWYIRITQRYAHLSASHNQNVVYLLDRESQQFSQQSVSQEVIFAAGN